MAKYITSIPDSGKMPLDRVVKRLNGTPDHPDLYFTALGTASDTGVTTAYGFAKNSPLACVGDVLTVATGSTTKQYVILDTAGHLAEIYNSNNLNVNNLISAQLATYIPNIGFQGDLPTGETEILKGQEFRAGRKLLGTSTTVMENDYLIATKDFTLPDSSELTDPDAVETMLENFVVVEQNLTGALVGINGATNNVKTFTSGKYISKIEIDSTGKLKFTESDLPVNGVTAVSATAGKYVSGISLSGGKVTVTTADLPLKGLNAVTAQSGKYVSGISIDANGKVTVTTANLPTIPTVEYPTMHTLVFNKASNGTGRNGILLGGISVSNGVVSVKLNAHARFAAPQVSPIEFHDTLIVEINGIRANYKEDYIITGTDSAITVQFTSSLVQQIGLDANDEIAVTYLAKRDAVAGLGNSY